MTGAVDRQAARQPWALAIEEAKEPAGLPERVYRSFDELERLPPDIRECVHEIGWEAVSVMRNYKLPASAMRTIAHVCWTSPRSAHQIQGWSAPKEERASPMLQHLDTLLHRAGSNISAIMLLAFLKRSGMLVVPYPASTPMVDASLRTVSTFDTRITKPEKHKRRLNAALEAGARRLWPRLFIDME